MDNQRVQHWIDDFSTFCTTVDVKTVVAAADAEGNAPPGYAKQVYAIAIVRALHDGALGGDWYLAQSAVARLWERGHSRGFHTDSFNAVLRELADTGTRPRPMVFARTEHLYGSAVGQ